VSDLVQSLAAGAIGGAIAAWIVAWLRVWTSKKNELRALLDRGTEPLPAVRLRLGWCRSDLEHRGIDDGLRRTRLEQLDDARVAAEVVRDLLRTRAGPDAPVFKEFDGALVAGEEARNELIRAADDEAPHVEASLEIVDSARQRFDLRHQGHLGAVGRAVVPRVRIALG
jgi:hypothetical protein